MEDQKLLWIVFSVVLFAVVVLASVLYFLKPKATEPVLAVAEGGAAGTGFDTYEYVRGSSPVLPVEERPQGDEDLQIVVGQESGAEGQSAAPVASAARSEPRQADQPKPSPAASASPKATAPKAAPAPERAKPQPAPKPTPQQPTQVFWIQTASFKSRSGAETMVAGLGQKGITGRIQVSDQAGQPYYRVRVGPYTSRGEAEKFLSWIKAVKGLEQSYISVVARSGEQAR